MLDHPTQEQVHEEEEGTRCMFRRAAIPAVGRLIDCSGTSVGAALFVLLWMYLNSGMWKVWTMGFSAGFIEWMIFGGGDASLLEVVV